MPRLNSPSPSQKEAYVTLLRQFVHVLLITAEHQVMVNAVSASDFYIVSWSADKDKTVFNNMDELQ